MTQIIQYIFWDSDNTLVETGEHHWRKHFETLKSLGIALDDKYRPAIKMNNGHQNYQWISDELGLTMSEQDYLTMIDAWYFDHVQEMTIRDGVLDALALFDQAGCKQAVVSNGRQRSVMAALSAKKLDEQFDFILCKEDYEGRKPEPGPYLAALKRMEHTHGHVITPAQCLVIEDAEEGAESAKAAGMACIYRPEGEDNTSDFLKTCQAYLA